MGDVFERFGEGDRRLDEGRRSSSACPSFEASLFAWAHHSD